MSISSNKPVLEVENLKKSYFVKKTGNWFTALDQLSFKVFESEFVSIVGPSGCGKSTILKLIAGLMESDDGRLLLDGKDIEGPGPERGMVFQSYTLFQWLTVIENIAFGLRLKKGKKRSEAEIGEICEYWINLIGLESFRDFYPNSLSGGMQQRVAIARAMANDPEILLLDEPFGALDAQTRSRMQEFTTQLWEKTRKTIIFVTHDIDEAIFLSERVIVLTGSPARVSKEMVIEIERPRDISTAFTLPVFVKNKKEILDEIMKFNQGQMDNLLAK